MNPVYATVFAIIKVMNAERIGEEHEGERYLRMLGLDAYAEHPINTPEGVIPAKDFMKICGNHARPILVGLESMDQNDPRYEATKNALCGLIGQYIRGEATD